MASPLLIGLLTESSKTNISTIGICHRGLGEVASLCFRSIYDLILFYHENILQFFPHREMQELPILLHTTDILGEEKFLGEMKIAEGSEIR